MKNIKSKIISILLAITVVVTTIDSSSITVNADIPDSGSIDSSVLAGSTIVGVDSGEYGEHCWAVDTECLTYITWAKIPKTELGSQTVGTFLSNALKNDPTSNIWTYNTKYCQGTPNATNAFGLLVSSQLSLVGFAVNDIGSSGSMPCNINSINSGHMSSYLFTANAQTVNSTKQLLQLYHNGAGAGESVLTQEEAVPDIHSCMQAIYTMLYKYGGLSKADYEAAVNYSLTGMGDTAYVILTSKLAIPVDIGGVIGTAQANTATCSCDVNAHTNTNGWHYNFGSKTCYAGFKTSELLQRCIKTYQGQSVSTFKATWGNTLSKVVAKRSISAANVLSSSPAGEIPYLVPVDYLLYAWGRNPQLDVGTGTILGGMNNAGSLSSVKENYHHLIESIMDTESHDKLPSVTKCPSLSKLFSEPSSSGLPNTGKGVLGMAFAKNMTNMYASAYSGTSTLGKGSYAYSNMIVNEDTGDITFGYSYLTVGGSGLAFDVSGEPKGGAAALTTGQSTTVNPVYGIRFHYKTPSDLNQIDSTATYAVKITAHPNVNIHTELTGSTIDTVAFASNVMSYTATGAQLRTQFETNAIVATFNAQAETLSYGQNKVWPCAFTVEIINNASGGKMTVTPAAINNSNKFVGFKAQTGNTLATSYGSNYAGSASSNITRIDWKQESDTTPGAYSEIVANEVGNQDWNVLQGIPSTENLTVHAGGDAFLVGYSGWTYRVGIAAPAGWTNAGAGTPMAGAATTRTITFVTTIKDIWGTACTNTPCTLSCPGHTYSECSHTGTKGCGCTGAVCQYCGATMGCSPKPHGKDKEGNPIDVYCDGVTGSCSHSGGVRFNCQTGTWSSYGEVAVTSQSKTLTQGQRYNGTCGWKCTHSAPGGGSQGHTNNAVLDEGYTNGYGCRCSNTSNHQHEFPDTKYFYLKECIDTWTYRQVCNLKLYGLSKSYIKSIDTKVLNGGQNEAVSPVGLKACLWRAQTNDNYDGYQNGNGRLWFSQFPEPLYKKGTGWVSTSVVGTGSGKTYDYWLGDCTVTITAYADQKVAQSSARSATSTEPWDADIRLDAGKQDNHRTGTVTSTVNTWQNSKYATGDWLSPTDITNQHLQMVNSWMNKNNIVYSIVSISDALSLAVNGSYAEDITGAMYAIKHSGGDVRLFDYPFSATGQTYYRNFNSVENNIFDENGRGGLIKLVDPTLKVGYSGSPNEASKKSGGKAYAKTYAYGLATGAITPSEYGANADTIVSGSACFKDAIAPTEKNKSGHTKWELVNTASTITAENFDGYWNDHDYPNTGSYSYQWKMNDNPVAGSAVTVTNSGSGNLNTYDSQLVISNIDILGTAKNGKYTPCVVDNNYVKLADISNDVSTAKLKLTERALTYKTEFKKGYGNINEVVIHDPITVQNCKVISNGAGNYGTGIVDETGEDGRTVTKNIAEKDKPDYWVIGNTIHIAYSDIGDFYSPLGTIMKNSTANQTVCGTGVDTDGCDVSTGELKDCTGYTNNMNTTPWVKERYVKFPCAVSYTDREGNLKTAKAESYIPLSDVMATAEDGTDVALTIGSASGDTVKPSTSTTAFHDIGKDKLDDFEDDGPFLYGLDFEFTLLTSSLEAEQAGVEFLTTAVNDANGWVNNDKDTHTNNIHLAEKQGMKLAAEASVRKTDYVDIVGRIGNLTIHDTGDFRYSNLFKKQTTGYLIPGVVPNTDYKTPNCIMSSKLDILGNVAGYNMSGDGSEYVLPELGVKTSHATLSVTNYSNTLGKAGPFYELPLAAAKNNIREFTNEQLRPGYDILMDIETIGNYYGTNKDAEGNAYYGPDSIDEMNSTVDTRINAVTIIPHYYLYNPTAKEYIPINIYSGVDGDRRLLWSNSSLLTTNSNAALYVDLPLESYRRNVSDTEMKVTDIVMTSVGEPSFAVDGSIASDFIGTTSKIVLDARNRTFIGSNIYYGTYGATAGSFINPIIPSYEKGWSQNGEDSLLYNEIGSDPETLLDDHDYLMRSQRWHFTIGLPSSTYLTEALIFDIDEQDKIEESHDRLKETYPEGILVCFLEMYAKDPVWELEYDDSISMGVTPTSTEGIKISNGPDFNIDTDDVYIYRPGKGATDTSGQIKQSWSLALLMDAWQTSAEDLDTYGTH